MALMLLCTAHTLLNMVSDVTEQGSDVIEHSSDVTYDDSDVTEHGSYLFEICISILICYCLCLTSYQYTTWETSYLIKLPDY